VVCHQKVTDCDPWEFHCSFLGLHCAEVIEITDVRGKCNPSFKVEITEKVSYMTVLNCGLSQARSVSLMLSADAGTALVR
jgi:hypothetical protein